MERSTINVFSRIMSIQYKISMSVCVCVKEKKKENAAKQKEKEKGMYTKVGSGRRLCNGDMMMDMEYKQGGVILWYSKRVKSSRLYP